MTNKHLLMIALIMTPISIVVNGWAIATAWNWFIPGLFGLPALSAPLGYALATLAYLIVPTPPKEDHDDKETGALIGHLLGRTIVGPLVMLATLWIALNWWL